MMEDITSLNPNECDWKPLYRMAGICALLAGILFRRNWAAELSLFGVTPSPASAQAWLELLQSQRWVGLIYLNVIDLLNYLLVGVLFLALYTIVRKVDRSLALIALMAGMAGIIIFLATNTAFSMLALSDAYAEAIANVQRNALINAADVLLTFNRFGLPGSQPGSSGLISLFLVAVAEVLFGVLMLRSAIFKRFTAWVGIVAGGLDLAYCVLYIFVPSLGGDLLAVLFIPLAGLCLMVWHTALGVALWKHA